VTTRSNIKGTHTVDNFITILYCSRTIDYATFYHQLGVSCSMIEWNGSKSSITADMAFRKDLPYRGAPIYPYTLDQSNIAREGYHDKTVSSSMRKFRGATLLSYPQRSRLSSENGPRSLRRRESLKEGSSERRCPASNWRGAQNLEHPQR
jgi:hypothetical protein